MELRNRNEWGHRTDLYTKIVTKPEKTENLIKIDN
jgi:hypothetical protein